MGTIARLSLIFLLLTSGCVVDTTYVQVCRIIDGVDTTYVEAPCEPSDTTYAPSSGN